MRLSRRIVLAQIPLLALPRRAGALPPAARVTAVTGTASARLPDGQRVALSAGMALPAGSRLQTAAGARAALALADGTAVNAGADTWIDLVADGGHLAGSLNLSGIAVVDRRTAAGGQAMTVTTADFEVMLEDARVYLASLEGGQVYVKEGEAFVTAPATLIVLAAGEGVELAAPPPPPPPSAGAGAAPAPAPAPAPVSPPDAGAAPPTRGTPLPGAPPAPGQEIRRWSDDQVDAAFASVGLIA